MKQFLTIAFACFALIGKTQEGRVETSVFGIQTGYLGIWGNHESTLTNTIVLRNEVGFDSELWGGGFYDKAGFLLIPVLTLEPRLYYSLRKRIAKAKRTANNSGNFISLKTSYHPDWFVISNYDNIRVISDISMIPTWGIRRHIGKHISYEAGIGIGYRYSFKKKAGYVRNGGDVAFNLLLRIGWTFEK